MGSEDKFVTINLNDIELEMVGTDTSNRDIGVKAIKELENYSNNQQIEKKKKRKRIIIAISIIVFILIVAAVLTPILIIKL
ncbi:hypothetical protein DDB_G0279273 [Dictyostelium discoideum AX4]|uniref:Uncharacterized protein n=1 Tax=Dictyostelium discoideum TaxID=44689 RepID=Q54X12_DICDI|nr:hypothetical protein DDB_G0279273 [Dictyostelium discoideum AX4]EAL67785.1 hypothetical protein DDB_G0279273 [Dictyostelium discoideum AX4]|eukprot:XP_641765.1 hypothetical protein DDB_G0279273 [Dictyostelium discoideum AX4]